MASAFLTDQEKARIRLHLGYLQTQPVASIVLGVPAAVQPFFLVELQMDRVLDTAVGVLRELIAKCDEFYARLGSVGDYLIAEKVGNMTIRADVADQFRREYFYWRGQLADFLGVAVNPYASGAQGGGIMRRRVAPC